MKFSILDFLCLFVTAKYRFVVAILVCPSCSRKTARLIQFSSTLLA
nr:MAG TPA: tyrosine-protein phosphatase non-receptor type [Inoviridae sp.]